MVDQNEGSVSSEKVGSVCAEFTFEAENENPLDMQRFGWQAILNNFK